jgi:hypothetical protein
MPKVPEENAEQNAAGLSATIEHQPGLVHADAVASAKLVHLIPESVQKRLEVLDTLTRRLHDQLVSIDTTLATQLMNITDELLALRRDMAELFREFKDGNMAAAAASYTTEVQLAEQSREDTAARLDRLEERDKQD